jgi:hypothetical protein
MTSTTQDALAALRRSALVRDDSGPTRVYRDKAGTLYHSVTSILSATADKSGLDNWIAFTDRIYGPGAATQDRNVAATRGTQAHNQAEFLLKLANKLARSTANKNGSLTWDDSGLARIPTPVFRWGLAKAAAKMPPVSWSAAGYARSLTGWIVQNVTQCHACEFAVSLPYGQLDPLTNTTNPFTALERKQSPLPPGTVGFAGTADGLISVSPETLERHGADPTLAGAPFIADWKTSASKRSPAMMADYCLQAGAYSLGLEHLTGIRPAGAFIVVARRVGPPNVTFMSQDELVRAQDGYLERVKNFYTTIQEAG